MSKLVVGQAKTNYNQTFELGYIYSRNYIHHSYFFMKDFKCQILDIHTALPKEVKFKSYFLKQFYV